jgi:EmrB/QacA subfamily drug resistance transporter
MLPRLTRSRLMTQTDTPPVPPATSRLVLWSIAVLLLLAALDQTIVSTALPTIVADLGGIDQLSWVVIAYALTSTVVAPLYGKLGDLYGRRNMVFTAVGLFLAGSALCGLSQSMPMLIGARAIQGLGGGGLFVLALSVVGDVIAPRERGKIQGIFAAVFSLSSVIGPLIGGGFVQVASWHWIFLINIPLGLAAVAAFAVGFAPKGVRTQRRIDWAGAATLSASLGGLTLLTSLGGRTWPWSSAPALALAAVVLIAAVAFILIERRAAEPILPLSLFGRNVFRNTSAIGFVTGALIFGAVTFLPIYLQIARGLSPMVSGLMLVPMTLGIISGTFVAGRYMGRTGRYRRLPVMGLMVTTAGALALTQVSATLPLWAFGGALVVYGLGMGCIFPVVTTAVQNDAPREQLGTATAAGVMFRQIGGSLAVAVFGALFAGRLAAGLGPDGAALLASGDLGPAALAGLDPALRDLAATAVVGAVWPIFAMAAGLGAVGLIFALMLQDVPLVDRRSAPPSSD